MLRELGVWGTVLFPTFEYRQFPFTRLLVVEGNGRNQWNKILKLSQEMNSIWRYFQWFQIMFGGVVSPFCYLVAYFLLDFHRCCTCSFCFPVLLGPSNFLVPSQSLYHATKLFKENCTLPATSWSPRREELTPVWDKNFDHWWKTSLGPTNRAHFPLIYAGLYIMLDQIANPHCRHHYIIDKLGKNLPEYMRAQGTNMD